MHLLIPHQSYLFPGLPDEYPGLKISTNATEWESQSLEPEELIIILAELKWGDYQYTDFEGFSILKQLRVVQKRRNPVAMISLLPKEWFLHSNQNTSFQALRTPGHHFHQLPIDWEQLFQLQPDGLHPSILQDINDSYFRLEGVIDEEIHDLKNKVLKNTKAYDNKTMLLKEILKEVHTALENIRAALHLSNNDDTFNKISTRLRQDLEQEILVKENYDYTINCIQSYVGEIKRLLPPDENAPIDALAGQKPPWKILFVDDDIDITRRVQELFADREMTSITANNATEVFNILRDDKDNHITVLICDYRMLNEDRSWQDLQGYNILEKVFLEFPNQLALFSLTSFNKRTLLRIQKLHNMQVWSYSKDNVIGNHQSINGFNDFAEKIIEEGNKVFEWKRSQPKASSWTKGYIKKFDRPLKDYYRLHFLSKDREAADWKIGALAKLFFEHIANLKHKKQSPITVDILPIQEGIGKEKKPITEEAKLLKFRDKLTGRRIAIALKELLEMDKFEIFTAIKEGIYSKRMPEETDNNINQFFSTYLALYLEKDIPNNLLPEEKSWLETLTNEYNR